MPPATGAMTRATLSAAEVSAAVAAVFHAGAASLGVDGVLDAGEYGVRPSLAQGSYDPTAFVPGVPGGGQP